MERLAADDRIFLRHSGRLDVVKVSDIALIKSMGNYCSIQAGTGKSIIIRKTLGSFEEILPEKNFLRISRSALINLDRIKKISRIPSGRLKVSLEDYEDEVIISQRFASKIKKLVIL